MAVQFLKGLAFGLILAATVGPMWILCFRRTLAHGRLFGFVSGMGVATADALYGFVAAFGLTAVSHFLLAQKFWPGPGGRAKCRGPKPVTARDGRSRGKHDASGSEKRKPQGAHPGFLRNPKRYREKGERERYDRGAIAPDAQPAAFSF